MATILNRKRILKPLHIRSSASVEGILQGNIIQYFVTIGQRVLRSRETPRRNADKSYTTGLHLSW